MSRGTDARFGRQGGRLEPWNRRVHTPTTTERHPLVGLRCSCPPDCTADNWGDGPRDCDPECEPCRIMAGKRYSKADLPGFGAKPDKALEP